jgi:ribokinase
MTHSRPNAILNLGSLNIDRVVRVCHIARPGETIAGESLAIFAGGKGANQSVALARAGAQVAHLGKIGDDGQWLLEKLSREQIDTRWVRVGSGPTGQAMIQVDDTGQNAIVLVGGANQDITAQEVDAAVSGFSAGSWLLTQNETSAVEHAIRSAKQHDLRVAFNPAPFDRRVLHYPLELVDLLCLNETEGAAMTGQNAAADILSALGERLPGCEIVLTLGAAGASYRGPQGEIHVPACQVDAVDTTAAGDTFLGYYLACRSRGLEARGSLQQASRAAALCVTRPGAMDSIPRSDETSRFG